ncbi:hypothetical protein [Polyangium spumosum]|uniref:DUF4157 domain-containing protein n=1 Tax=Polyangium spumosum TaxID=889282 RepID=A0A6N7PYX0_9BACT|nr:hypothetical protein [Polyangium spumosum]MRG97412.1 hypothetical protein [Polyangium spumosum]
MGDRAGQAAAIGLLFALTACGGSSPPPAEVPSPPPPAPLTQERIQALVAEVAHLRGLPLRAAVPVYLLDEPTFLAALRERADRRAAAAEVEARTAFHLAFDLLPDGKPGAGPPPSSTREVLEEQVRGFYDHEKKIIVVRASRPRTEAESEKERAILAHEIEHALQDQSFGRPDAREQATMGADEVLAYGSLLEGDAMLTMFAYLASERGVPMQRMVRRAADVMRDVPAERFVANDGDTALLRAPPIVRERLLFRYHAGTAMVAELYRAGGLDLVNRMFVSPPVSTEQVMHPEKYLAGERPVVLAAPQAPAGYRPLDEGTLGELETRVVLDRCTPLSTQAAAGWGGDRYTLVAAQSGGVGLLWSTAWDAESDAVEFVAAIQSSPGCLRALSLGSASIEGGIVVRAEKNRVAVVRGLAGPLAEASARQILESPIAAPTSPPVALPYRLPPRAPLPRREPGWLVGHDYFSRWLGIAGRIPLGVNAIVGHEGLELRISRPDVLVSGALFVSDLVTAPRFQEKLFADVAGGLERGAEGSRVVTARTGPVPTPLGAGIERWWTVGETPISVRAVMVPICGGTGSIVFLQSFRDPDAQRTLDGWMHSFRWNTGVKPPVCEALDPR